MWHFYEWQDGIHGDGAIPGKPDALYNLYFLEVLDAYAETAEDPMFRCRANELRKAIFAAYYRPECGALLTYDNSPEIHEITQILALYNKCVPDSEREKIVAGLLECKHLKISLGSIRYYYAALVREGKKCRSFLARKLWDDFGRMVQGNSTTMWETIGGENDFHQAGSLCHGWSALPIWYFYALKLGLRPLTPGWKQFEIAPVEFQGIEAFGEVPIKDGKIRLRITKTDSGLKLECTGPESLSPIFRPWDPDEYSTASWNGKPLFPVPAAE